MSDIEQLISTAKTLSGDESIGAAGIFALKDQYLKLVGWSTVGGLAGSAVAGELGDVAGSRGAAALVLAGAAVAVEGSCGRHR